MSVLIKGLEMPETGYMDVRIFRDGTATIATGTKPYYRELKAEPVRHGKWLWVDGVRCSQCNYKLQTTGLPSYCPNCGADMRGEE